MFGDDFQASQPGGDFSDVSLSSAPANDEPASEQQQPAGGKTIHPPDDSLLNNDVSAQPEPSEASDLLEIKQKALDHLGPLVSHLDQTPEEKFRTTMMMIQASDNQDLIKDAYEAAQSIPDDKMRAQALLDVVNEINYFNQQKNGGY